MVLHIVLVLLLVPLLFLKILIARRYKQSFSSLKVLGIAIFVVSSALVSVPTLSELLRSANPGSLGIRLATGVIVAVCLIQCALVFRNLSTLFFCDSGINHLLAGSSSVGNQFTVLHNRRQQAGSRQTANR